MKKINIRIIYFLLISLMAFSAAFPLLLSKASDHRLLGKIHLQKIDVQDGKHSRQNSVIDKLRLLYDKRINSKDIVVVKNTQLPETDLEKIKSSCYAELQQLKEKKLFPDIEDDLNTGFEVSAFTCIDTSKSDVAVNFFIIMISSSKYRISFTIDADTHKIYELNISSASKPLAIDYDNASLNWQNYIGLSLVQADNFKEGLETGDDSNNDNRPLPFLNSMAKVLEDDYTDDNRQFPSENSMAKVLEDDYTDGEKRVTYLIVIANDKKSFTITWSFH